MRAPGAPERAAPGAASRPIAWAPAAWELNFSALLASGPGGQNVHKVATAVQLRFDIRRSTLPAAWKERLLHWPDQRITQDGEVVIKVQTHRSQSLNQAEAVERLLALVAQASHVAKARRATRPTWGSQQRRLQSKAEHSARKAARRAPLE